jgi:hypothetical protein
MRTRDSLDRGALVLGVVSIVSAVFVFVHGTFQSFKLAPLGWSWRWCWACSRLLPAGWTNVR